MQLTYGLRVKHGFADRTVGGVEGDSETLGRDAIECRLGVRVHGQAMALERTMRLAPQFIVTVAHPSIPSLLRCSGLFSVSHAARCVARHGVASAPNPSAEIMASRENVARHVQASMFDRCSQ